MADDIARIGVDGIRETIAALKATPERYDKEARKEFRAIAKEIVPDARAEATSARPPRLTPKHDGAYHWSTVVNTIRSGADSDTPYVVFGSDRVPGWPGHVFGSDQPQFRPRLPKNGRGNEGYFFFPTVDKYAEDVERRVLDVVNDLANEYLEG